MFHLCPVEVTAFLLALPTLGYVMQHVIRLGRRLRGKP